MRSRFQAPVPWTSKSCGPQIISVQILNNRITPKVATSWNSSGAHRQGAARRSHDHANQTPTISPASKIGGPKTDHCRASTCISE